jgi:Concanavalin A-like lectin/glucanases superfamily
MKGCMLSGVLGAVVLALAPAVASAAVVAEWKMNEASGATTMKDSASLGGANNGTIKKVTTGVPGLVSGKAYRFGGTTSHVKVPDHPELDPGTRKITLEASVQISGKPMSDDSYDLIRKGEAGTSGGYWKMELARSDLDSSVGYLNCVFKGPDSSGKVVSVTKKAFVDIADGKPHKLRCVRSGSTVQAVVDGRAFTRSAPVVSMSNNQPVRVGAKESGDDVLQGVLDQVSISVG